MSTRGDKRHRAIDRYVGIPLVFALGTLRRPRGFPDDVATIGLLALGAIGDLLLSAGSSAPALRKVHSGAKIVLFTSSTNKATVSLLPHFDAIELLELTNITHAVRTLNHHKLDILIDFCQWPRISAILAALCNAKLTVGFLTKGQHRHYAYDIMAEHRNTVHELQNYGSLAAAVGAPQLERPQISLSPDVLERAPALGGRPYVVCHPWPAGFRHEMRAWPNEYWRRLAYVLLERGYNVAFTGAPGDKASSEALVSVIGAQPDRVFDLTGKLKLEETAALLSKAAVVVSVNTGVMHIAAALDCPMLALHGPTNPLRWGPLSEKAIVLLPDASNVAYLNLGFEYPKGVEPCMHLLSVDKVLKAFNDLTSACPKKSQVQFL